MVKIQIELSDRENKIVSIYKIMNGHITKADAIKAIIRKFNTKKGL